MRYFLTMTSFFLLTTFVGACSKPQSHASVSPDCTATVSAPTGRISGTVGRVAGVCRYLGIRYGQAPTGDLRFAPPLAAPDWPGIYDATVQGSDCLQKLGLNQEQLSLDPPAFGKEDCLFLNVYTPGEPAKISNKPVMVFIYGGAFVIGSASWDLYEGSKLAADGVIVVTMNYRLGPFGFFASKELRDATSDHSFGNQGLQDQRLALTWVQRNIRAFGGNPNQVTIFGESAGGMSVCSHMASPLSRGLFQGAIIESGGCKAVTPAARAFAHAATWTRQAGCEGAPEGELACLRAQNGKELLNTLRFDSVNDGIEPTLDDVNLSKPPLDYIKDGTQAPVPLLAGSNADEVRITSLIQVPVLQLRKTSWATFYNLLTQIYPADLAQALPEFYGETNYDTPYDAWTDLQNDWVLGCPTQLAVRSHVASGQVGWHYRFNWSLAGKLGAEIGAHHGMELFFVFGNLDPYAGLVSREDMLPARTLSDNIRKTWAAFAATGDPNTTAWDGWQSAAKGTWEMAINARYLPGWKQKACDLLGPWLATGLDKMTQPAFHLADLL